MNKSENITPNITRKLVQKSMQEVIKANGCSIKYKLEFIVNLFKCI